MQTYYCCPNGLPHTSLIVGFIHWIEVEGGRAKPSYDVDRTRTGDLHEASLDSG